MTDPHPPSELPDLSPAELHRYGRHLVLPEVGLEGQRRLAAARVLLVGAGGLGSPVALYLAAAGVGALTVVDPDAVEASNLQRQVLYGTQALGRAKVEAARERLQDLNPHVAVTALPEALTRDNAMELVSAHDLVVDGTDNFASRYLVNDACVLAGRVNVYASVYRFEGQASVLAAPGGPCYRCLHPRPPPPGTTPSCAEGGVLGVVPGLLGLVQATEALKLLLGTGEPLIGRLLLVDALSMGFLTVKLRPDPACPACGTRELRELPDHQALCGVPVAAGRRPVQGIAPAALAARRARGEALQLVDVREAEEWAFGRIGGARLLPLATLPAAATGLDPAREVVVYCRSGVRSAEAARLLSEAGFAQVVNLEGGILRFAAEGHPGLETGRPADRP